MPPRSAPEWTVIDFIHRGYWWKNHGILVLNFCLLLPLITAFVNGLDSSLVNGLQILPVWQKYYKTPSGVALGLINSAQNVGALIGLPLTPFASDNFGRRGALFLGSLIMLAGVFAQFLASSVEMLIGARVIIGFGLTFCANAAPLLITELCYPTQRGKITSLFNTTWYVGSVTSAWVVFGAYDRASNSDWSFKIPILVQAAAPLLQVILIWFIPESPRFLVSKGKEGEAARVLAKYHANGGDERDPLVVFEMAQIRHALKAEKELTKAASYWVLFSTPGNRRRLKILVAVALFSQWSGNGLVSYYINLVLEGVGIHSTRTKAAINGGLQVWNLASAITGSMLVDYVGRRPLFIASNTIMLLTFSMWTLTTGLFNTIGDTAAAKATIPLIFVFYLGYDICYTPLLVAYGLEILPYNIRAKGFAVTNLTIYLTSAFNQFFNPWALSAIGWKYYLVYCAWLAFELIFVILNIVETKGRTLEETAVLFDGEQGEALEQDLVQAGGDAATISMTLSRAEMVLSRIEIIPISNVPDDVGADGKTDLERQSTPPPPPPPPPPEKRRSSDSESQGSERKLSFSSFVL